MCVCLYACSCVKYTLLSCLSAKRKILLSSDQEKRGLLRPATRTLSPPRSPGQLFVCVPLRWRLNDSFIVPTLGSRYALVGGNLHISHLNKEEDVGIYQCLASNSFGTIVSREASLHMACEFTFNPVLCMVCVCVWVYRGYSSAETRVRIVQRVIPSIWDFLANWVF